MRNGKGKEKKGLRRGRISRNLEYGRCGCEEKMAAFSRRKRRFAPANR